MEKPPAEFDLLATCTFGLEAVVAREVEQLGYDASVIGTGRVLFRGDERAICEANLWLRAADRVLIRVGTFEADNFDALFEGVKGLAWERWIAREAAFPVAGRCVRSRLSSEPAVQRATKRAIVDRLKSTYGSGGLDALLPETGPRVAVEVSILRDVATLTIDTSGVGLHKRGYREGVQPAEAALRETLAAGLVLLSVWRPGRPLVDPFCGSGTIAIEAAMIGRSIAPGLHRPSGFDAERWIGAGGTPLIDPAVWEEAREEARASIVPDRLDPVIHASDVNEEALRLARRNARAAGFGIENDIQFLRRDVAELTSTKEYGVIVTNPPYGVRIGAGGEDEERSVERLYRSLPSVFRRLPTWSFHILSGRLDLERLFGQQATRRRKLYNSKIECTYFSFLGPRPRNDRRDAEHPEKIAGAEEAGVDVPQDLSAEELEHLSSESAPSAAPEDQTDESLSVPSAPRRSAHVSGPAFGGLRERDEREAAEFGRCLANNLRHLRKYPARGIFCYRVYERDVPDVPLIVDRYQAVSGEVFFHAAEHEREHSRTAAQQADWFDLMRRTIAEVGEVAPANVFMKEKHRQAGLTQHEKVASARSTIIVQEGEPGLKFEVNLSDYVDTGLFLDHRLTRQMFREEVAKRTGGGESVRTLNLFCYTGSFSVYAASAGAVTTSVDLSNTYLDWARRNLGLNNLYSNQHRLVRSDALEFLRTEGAAVNGAGGGRYDLAIVDPPTFSNSKSTERDWEVESSHAELLGLLAPLMAPSGVVYFSTNFRRFKLDEGAVASAGLAAREITRRTIPPEFRNKRIHRCWRMVNVGPEAAAAELAARSAGAERSISQAEESE